MKNIIIINLVIISQFNKTKHDHYFINIFLLVDLVNNFYVWCNQTISKI